MEAFDCHHRSPSSSHSFSSTSSSQGGAGSSEYMFQLQHELERLRSEKLKLLRSVQLFKAHLLYKNTTMHCCNDIFLNLVISCGRRKVVKQFIYVFLLMYCFDPLSFRTVKLNRIFQNSPKAFLPKNVKLGETLHYSGRRKDYIARKVYILFPPPPFLHPNINLFEFFSIFSKYSPFSTIPQIFSPLPIFLGFF